MIRDKNIENSKKEKKTIVDKLKGMGMLVIAFGIGEIFRIADSKWFLYGFILLLIVIFVISLSLTIRNNMKKSDINNTNIDKAPN